MQIIKSLDDAKKILTPQKYGIQAMADIIFETFIQETDNKVLDAQIILLDDEEKFDKPHDEPLIQIPIGRCLKEVYLDHEYECLTIFYTNKGFYYKEFFETNLSCVREYVKDKPYFRISDIQREYCVSYPEAVEMHQILISEGILEKEDNAKHEDVISSEGCNQTAQNN